MKYEVGDMVRIVRDKYGLRFWNNFGRMDKWLGQVMTIRAIEGDYYKMFEDTTDTDCNSTSGWNWYEDMIEGLAEDEDIELNDIEQNKVLDEFLLSYTAK